jgi:hypothetical protein
VEAIVIGAQLTAKITKKQGRRSLIDRHAERCFPRNGGRERAAEISGLAPASG